MRVLADLSVGTNGIFSFLPSHFYHLLIHYSSMIIGFLVLSGV